MKKIILILAFLATASIAFGADMDASRNKEKKQKDTTGVKTGLNFGPLPAIGYSTDLGWHYGALTDVYWYGDGSKYPEYIWKGNIEISRYSKGNTVFHTFFDSKYLVPGVRISAAVSYFLNNTYNFYGFNGNASLYNRGMDRIVKLDYDGKTPGIGTYIMKRDIFRVMTCFQGNFGETNFGWAAGLNYTWFRCGDAKNRGLMDETGGRKNRVDVWGDNIPSLYSIYLENGIIPAAQAAGGHHLELKFGCFYDTRDHENMPSKGTNVEVYFFGSPDILNKRAKEDRTSYLKLAVHVKQFFPLVGDKLVLGMHAAYQGIIAGTAPFYSLQTIQSLNMKQINTEGLGSTCTLRGTTSNRFMGNGYAWSNIELRWKFVTFDWINQHWAIAVNPFFDFGGIVQPYRLQAMKDARETYVAWKNDAGHDASLYPATQRFQQQLDELVANGSIEKKAKNVVKLDGDSIYANAENYLYTGVKDNIHLGAGMGLHIIMNTNFNISFEFAKCINPFFKGNDGVWGMNVGLNYIF